MAKKPQGEQKSGRPTSYSVELADAICDRLMAGESMRGICADKKMPDRTTVGRWMAADDAFAAKCARARVIQADSLEEDMSDIEERTLVGEIDPAVARVVLSSKQWRASKMAPKKYGDRTTLAGDAENPLAVLTMDKIAANPKSRLRV